MKKKKIFTLKKLKSTYTWTIDWFKIHFYSRMAAEPLQLAPIGLFLQCWVSTFWYPQERTCLKLKFRVRTISIDFQTSEWCHIRVPNKRCPLWLSNVLKNFEEMFICISDWQFYTDICYFLISKFSDMFFSCLYSIQELCRIRLAFSYAFFLSQPFRFFIIRKVDTSWGSAEKKLSA